jgi:hypothetical protein
MLANTVPHTAGVGSTSAVAGTSGAAGRDTSAAPGCGASRAIFCEDFESQTAAGAEPALPTWSVVKNGMGRVEIDSQTAAHSGKSSVKVSSEGGYQTFFALSGAPIFPRPGALYLRVYIRLAAAMTSGHNTYFKSGKSGSPSSEHETRFGVMNGMLMINQPAGDRGFLSNEEYYRDGNKPGVVFAPMTWVCVEAFLDPEHSTIDVWVDGKEVPDLHRTDWQQDPIGAFHFGFEKYAGPDATLWYDDIAVGEQPIGCN